MARAEGHRRLRRGDAAGPLHPTAGSIKRCLDPRCASTHCLWRSWSTPQAWTRPVPALHQADTAQGRGECRVQHLRNAQAHPRAALVLAEHQPWQEAGTKGCRSHCTPQKASTSPGLLC